MSRNFIVALGLVTSIACADPGAVTSPKAGAPRAAAADVVPCTAGQGQQLIDAGQYKQAIKEFTCVVDLDPTAVEGYRGRIEAKLMLGQFSEAMRDYGRVTALVEPVHPDAARVIVAGYESRLKVVPDDITALTGQSFAY